MTVYFLWAVELWLESLGACLNFKRSKLLFFFLAMCAIGDLVTFAVFRISPAFYPWATWIRHAIKNLILLWLGCWICGQFVSERRRSTAVISTGMITACTVALVSVFFFAQDTWKNRLLDSEILMMVILWGVVALGWIGRQGRLTPAWKWITAGFLIMIGSDLLCTALWTFWDGARHWYPLGAISAQMVWVIGPLKSHKLAEARVNLGQRIPEGEKVSVC